MFAVQSHFLESFRGVCSRLARDLVMRSCRCNASLALDRGLGPFPFHVCILVTPLSTPNGAAYCVQVPELVPMGLMGPPHQFPPHTPASDEKAIGPVTC